MSVLPTAAVVAEAELLLLKLAGLAVNARGYAILGKDFTEEMLLDEAVALGGKISEATNRLFGNRDRMQFVTAQDFRLMIAANLRCILEYLEADE